MHKQVYYLVEIKICTSMDLGKILPFIWLLFTINFVISDVCNNTHVNNLIGNTARNVSGWNIKINYGQYEGT